MAWPVEDVQDDVDTVAAAHINSIVKAVKKWEGNVDANTFALLNSSLVEVGAGDNRAHLGAGIMELSNTGFNYIDFKSAWAKDFDCRFERSASAFKFWTGGSGAAAVGLELGAVTNYSLRRTEIWHQGYNPAFHALPTGNYAASAFNFQDASGQGGLVVGHMWGASDTSILNVGSVNLPSHGAFKSFFSVRGDGNIYIGRGYNTGHIVFTGAAGEVHMWLDSIHRLRLKLGAPTSDTDGVVAGTQS